MECLRSGGERLPRATVEAVALSNNSSRGPDCLPLAGGPGSQNDSLKRCISRAKTARSSFGPSFPWTALSGPSRAARAASKRRCPPGETEQGGPPVARVRLPVHQSELLQRLDLPAERALADAGQLRGQVGEPGRAGAAQPEQQAVAFGSRFGWTSRAISQDSARPSRSNAINSWSTARAFTEVVVH